MNIPFIVLSIFFLFSSFAFNCTENWAIATCEVILFLGAGISGLLNKDFFKFPRKLALIALFVSFLVLICIVQLIPIPVSVWKVFDNSRIQMYEDGAKAEELLQSKEYRVDPFEKSEAPYESVRYTPKMPSFLTITRTPIPTLRALIAILSFFCFLLLLEDVMNQGNRQLRKLGLLVGLIGLTIGVIALVEKGIEHRTHILWLRESTRAQTAFGPFVNNNHGEAFINLTFPILCYLIWRKYRTAKYVSNKIGLIFITISCLVLQYCLVFDGLSRGNLLCVSLIPVVFLMQLGLSKKKTTFIILGFLILCIEVTVFLLLFREGLLTSTVRHEMNINVLQNITLLGRGVNSFGEMFQVDVNEWDLFFPMRNSYLENEYLQLIYEGGIATIVPILLVVLAVLKIAIREIPSKNCKFWLTPPIIAEAIRISVDMSFHIFPISSVYVLCISFLLNERIK